MNCKSAFASLALAGMLLLAVGSPASADGTQLLTNPGFEDGGGSYNGWFTFGHGVQLSTPATENIYRSGTTASKIFGEFNGCPIPNFDVGGYGQAFTPIVGQLYEFSGYSFVANIDTIPGNDTCIGNRAIAKIVFFNAVSGGNEISSNEIIIGDWSTPRQQWIPFSVKAPAPAGALRVEALILFLQPGCDNGSVFVDDLFFSQYAPPVEPNVLVNPSFNTNLTGWTTFGNVFYDARAFARRTPTGAAKLFGTFTPGSDSGMYQRFNTTPGTDWRLRVYALNTCVEDAIRGTNENVAYAVIEFRDVAGLSLGGDNVIIGDNSTPLGTWKQYEVTATAPAATSTVDALIVFTQGAFLEGGAIFVDDVAFTNDLATGIGDAPRSTVAMHQNVPNPFNPSTRIAFDLGQRENVTLSVYDIKGRHLKTLYSGELGAGPHFVEWDGTSSNGSPVSSGVYLYVLRTANETIARRMVLLK